MTVNTFSRDKMLIYQGEEQGEAKTRAEVVRKMAKKGNTPEEISSLFDWPIEEVRKAYEVAMA